MAHQSEDVVNQPSDKGECMEKGLLLPLAQCKLGSAPSARDLEGACSVVSITVLCEMGNSGVNCLKTERGTDAEDEGAWGFPRFLQEVLITRRWAHKLVRPGEAWRMSVHPLT